MFDFYADLEELGFEQSFAQAFGRTHIEHLAEFEEFIQRPKSEMLAIFPS